jgi:hypothetical protein
MLCLHVDVPADSQRKAQGRPKKARKTQAKQPEAQPPTVKTASKAAAKGVKARKGKGSATSSFKGIYL